MKSTHKEINDLIVLINGLHSTIERLSRCFREDNQSITSNRFDNNSPDFWRSNIYGDAPVKIRIILENNFKQIETIGLVAVTRYIFEISVWLS